MAKPRVKVPKTATAGEVVTIKSLIDHKMDSGQAKDKEGNLIFRKTARNFNPMMATAGKVTVAEVEELVEIGELDPDQIHTPGIFVQRIKSGTFFI